MIENLELQRSQAEHEFGGVWTELKLNAVADYLRFYTTALQAKPKPETPFGLWYIDAFAGTGDRTVQVQRGPLEHEPGRWERVRLEGSARRALSVDPPFRHFRFIERDQRRFEALSRIKSEFPNRDIQCLNGDANAALAGIFQSSPWTSRAIRGLQRAVVFLDPYGMNVKWETLKMLADTRRADVWYLFPLHAVLRQLAHDRLAVDNGKAASLNEIFGSDAWESEFYTDTSAYQTSLFDAAPVIIDRHADPRRVAGFAQKRLRTIFQYVSDPIPILTRHRLHQFALFAASGNPSGPALSLISQGVGHIVRKYTLQASRRRFGP